MSQDPNGGGEFGSGLSARTPAIVPAAARRLSRCLQMCIAGSCPEGAQRAGAGSDEGAGAGRPEAGVEGGSRDGLAAGAAEGATSAMTAVSGGDGGLDDKRGGVPARHVCSMCHVTSAALYTASMVPSSRQRQRNVRRRFELRDFAARERDRLRLDHRLEHLAQ